MSRFTDDQIKYMVDRFLMWRLPESFNPDGGISFKKTFNEHTAHPMKHEPVGTNLLDAMQATAMVRHMIDGLPFPLLVDNDWLRSKIETDPDLDCEAGPSVTSQHTQPSEQSGESQ